MSARRPTPPLPTRSRSAAAAPLLLLSASLSTGMLAAVPAAAQTEVAAAPAATIDAATRKSVVEAVIAKIDAAYVFPDKAKVIGKALRRKLNAGAYDAIGDPTALAKAVTDDIQAAASDRHMRVFWRAEGLPPRDAEGRPDPVEMQRQLEAIARANYEIRRVEVLDGNVGYLKMNQFLPAELGGETLAAAMAFLKHSDALIFDMRDNGGGDPGMVAMTVSYLVPPGTLINSFHQRGKDVDDQIWSLPHVPGGRWSTDKPVYVLTSRNTGSGAEEFAYDVQQMKRGTIIGEPTWGGANPGDMVPIDQHFAIFIPTGAAVNPVSKTNWEGVGVKPDVAVDPATALEVAHRMAVEKLMEGAQGERRKELEGVLKGLK